MQKCNNVHDVSFKITEQVIVVVNLTTFIHKIIFTMHSISIQMYKTFFYVLCSSVTTDRRFEQSAFALFRVKILCADWTLFNINKNKICNSIERIDVVTTCILPLEIKNFLLLPSSYRIDEILKLIQNLQNIKICKRTKAVAY